MFVHSRPPSYYFGCTEIPQHLLEGQLQLVLAQQSGKAWTEEQPLKYLQKDLQGVKIYRAGDFCI